MTVVVAHDRTDIALRIVRDTKRHDMGLKLLYIVKKTGLAGLVVT